MWNQNGIFGESLIVHLNIPILIKMRNSRRFLALTLISGLLLFSACTPQQQVAETTAPIIYPWKQYRGANVQCWATEQDVKNLAASGANLLRFSMPICTLMDMEEPYAFNEDGFSLINNMLNWGEKYGISVLIDPHRYPGTEHKWTMLGSDPFWKEQKYQNLIIDLFDTLAQIGAKRGEVLAGYDLLNEPEIRPNYIKDSTQDINRLYAMLTEAIRKRDSVHTIVYALPRYWVEEEKKMYGYHEGIKYFELPTDNNICLETHTYMPMPFTHQGIWEESPYIAYPGEIEGVYWDSAQLELDQKILIEFSKANPEVPIFVGEFSCPRQTGEDGIQYITDVINIAEKHGWSWAYHAFRENEVWDAEMSSERKDTVRRESAPRWMLLKSYFAKN